MYHHPSAARHRLQLPRLGLQSRRTEPLERDRLARQGQVAVFQACATVGPIDYFQCHAIDRRSQLVAVIAEQRQSDQELLRRETSRRHLDQGGAITTDQHLAESVQLNREQGGALPRVG